MPKYRALWNSETSYWHEVEIPQEIIDKGDDDIFIFLSKQGFDSSIDEQGYAQDELMDWKPVEESND